MSNTETYSLIDKNIIDCEADMKVVSFLLDHIPNWDNCLVERHHRFVSSYLKYGRNVEIAAKVLNYSEQDILRVFWRIQRKLMMQYIEMAGNGKIKIKTEKPARFDLFLKWQLTQFRDDADLVFDYIDKKTPFELDKSNNEVKKKNVKIIEFPKRSVK